MMQVSVLDFEHSVFELDRIRVVIRATEGSMVEAYPFKRKAPGNMTIGSFINNRIIPFIDDNQFEIIDGAGSLYIHKRRTVSSIRESYTEG